MSFEVICISEEKFEKLEKLYSEYREKTKKTKPIFQKWDGMEVYFKDGVPYLKDGVVYEKGSGDDEGEHSRRVEKKASVHAEAKMQDQYLALVTYNINVVIDNTTALDKFRYNVRVVLRDEDGTIAQKRLEGLVRKEEI
jgi:hypothetical protein